ncbi:MAG TPA: RDD family protein [Dermatophilaceae bacterium]|nr:RDD family protein [Dermatophilaceae bacterium]
MSSDEPAAPASDDGPAGGTTSSGAGPLSRAETFSWLSGPRAAVEGSDADLGYRGRRLGFPEHGLGSVASFGRRAVAITVDWLACYLVAWAVLNQLYAGADLAEVRLWNSLLFFVEVWVLTTLTGSTFGQRLCGIAVRRLDLTQLSSLRCLARTGLLMLVVPALIWDRDGRGLHDKAVGSVVVER